MLTGFRKWMEGAGFIGPRDVTNNAMGVRSNISATDTVRQRSWGEKKTDPTNPPPTDHKPPEETFGFTDRNPLQQQRITRSMMNKKMGKK